MGRPSGRDERGDDPRPRALRRVCRGGGGAPGRGSRSVPALPGAHGLRPRRSRRLPARRRRGAARGAPDRGAQGGAMTDDRTRLLTCVLARELRDGEIVAFGLHAEMMLAAAYLAQRLHAPNLLIRHGLRAERGAPIGPAAWTDDRAATPRGVIEYLE